MSFFLSSFLFYYLLMLYINPLCILHNMSSHFTFPLFLQYSLSKCPSPNLPVVIFSPSLSWSVKLNFSHLCPSHSWHYMCDCAGIRVWSAHPARLSFDPALPQCFAASRLCTFGQIVILSELRDKWCLMSSTENKTCPETESDEREREDKNR